MRRFVPRRVHRDPVADVRAAATQIGRIDEGRAGRVELRDEDIPGAAAIRALDEAAHCARKAGPRRVGIPGHIGVAGCVHGDPLGIFNAAAV